jgi:hypothetical protein
MIGASRVWRGVRCLAESLAVTGTVSLSQCALWWVRCRSTKHILVLRESSEALQLTLALNRNTPSCTFWKMALYDDQEAQDLHYIGKRRRSAFLWHGTVPSRIGSRGGLKRR